MEVKLIEGKKVCYFGDLICGDTFAYENSVFVVIKAAITEDGVRNNAYCFDDGNLTHFLEGDIVNPVYAEVIARFK